MTELAATPPSTLRATLERLAPGTGLRDGLERILRGRTGALIVLGYDDRVEAISDGGFEIDVPFAPTRLRELCKMDGAVVLSTDGSRIRRANVQLMPDPMFPTEESGTRHRSAERTALQTGYPVISVSQSMNIITVYVDKKRHILEGSSDILSRANQAIATMERYRTRLDQVNERLFMAELHNYASLTDVITVIQRLEMLRRAAETIDRDVIELGTDGKQLGVQLEELFGDNDKDREFIFRDYLVAAELPSDEDVKQALGELEALSDIDIVKSSHIARILGFPTAEEALHQWIVPRGYRILGRVPRVQPFLMDKLILAFGDSNKLLEASVEDIAAVENVGALWARHIRDGLIRLKA
ncbi:DNA integrity scanning protein DisA [Corynebacterium kalinowskii]|uniref:DNA integrity scanning protein DisA n=1 Tax=Corynebacterium kalinowskii TaxID=2675216 RepID=A0A6B8VP02_9CORY|nr:DNA integrity scanning diadenylate cyclase DisA [Corynebacterium kalinowskii]QGU01277.1 DNA integrity scanning protein DisA [Corynebacterium kalinowskii]